MPGAPPEEIAVGEEVTVTTHYGERRRGVVTEVERGIRGGPVYTVDYGPSPARPGLRDIRRIASDDKIERVPPAPTPTPPTAAPGRPTQYRDLSDAYPPGYTQIWYAKPDTPWFENVNYKKIYPAIEDLDTDYVMLGTVKETDLNKIYDMMQADRWSPQGEANMLIQKLDLSHTSMMVGDVIRTPDNKYHVVDREGFTEIKHRAPAPPPPKPATLDQWLSEAEAKGYIVTRHEGEPPIIEGWWLEPITIGGTGADNKRLFGKHEAETLAVSAQVDGFEATVEPYQTWEREYGDVTRYTVTVTERGVAPPTELGPPAMPAIDEQVEEDMEKYRRKWQQAPP